MNAIETFVAEFIINTIHKSAPNMTAADDAKVTQAVLDFVNTGMDLVGAYFAIRNSKK